MRVGRVVERFRAVDRSVSLKGVAERTVPADVGLWPLRLVSADNDLELAQRKIERDRHIVLAVLARFGLDSTHTELPGFEVADTRANMYQGGAVPTRFIIAATLMVPAGDPECIRDASQRVGDLVAAGEFARQSGAAVGGIRRASQGVFEILPRAAAQ